MRYDQDHDQDHDHDHDLTRALSLSAKSKAGDSHQDIQPGISGYDNNENDYGRMLSVEHWMMDDGWKVPAR